MEIEIICKRLRDRSTQTYDSLEHIDIEGDILETFFLVITV